MDDSKKIKEDILAKYARYAAKLSNGKMSLAEVIADIIKRYNFKLLDVLECFSDQLPTIDDPTPIYELSEDNKFTAEEILHFVKCFAPVIPECLDINLIFEDFLNAEFCNLFDVQFPDSFKIMQIFTQNKFFEIEEAFEMLEKKLEQLEHTDYYERIYDAYADYFEKKYHVSIKNKSVDPDEEDDNLNPDKKEKVPKSISTGKPNKSDNPEEMFKRLKSAVDEINHGRTRLQYIQRYVLGVLEGAQANDNPQILANLLALEDFTCAGRDFHCFSFAAENARMLYERNATIEDYKKNTVVLINEILAS